MRIFGKDNNENIEEEKNNIANELNKSSLWSRIFKNEENQVYSDIIVKGFVWVIMFLISLVALVIVFKDGYNSSKEVVVITAQNDNNYTRSNDISPSSNFTFDSLKNDNSKTIETDNSKKTSASSIPKKLNEESTISKATPSIDDKYKNNSLMEDSTIAKKEDSANVKEDNNTIGDLIKNTSANKNSSTALAKNNVNVKPAKTSATISNSKIWLVTVYSASTEEFAKNKWLEIKKKNPSLFDNKKPYFIKTNVPGKGIFYRVSLGDIKSKGMPLFATAKEASTYCSYLKHNKVNCFIIEAKESSLNNK